MARDAEFVAVFLFPQRSLSNGDLSRWNSETGSLGGLMILDVDVSWLVVVFILLSDSMSLSLSGVATGGAGRGSSPPIHPANGSMLHAA